MPHYHITNKLLESLVRIENAKAKAYEAISVGPSHNYYFGRAEAEITSWLEYFLEGMADAFENVLKRLNVAGIEGKSDHMDIIRKIEPRQRKVLELFQEFDLVTSRQIGDLFGFQPRTNAHICKQWVNAGFLEVAIASKKARKYRLGKKFRKMTN